MVELYLLVGISIACCFISLYAILRPPDSRLARRITARMTAVEMEWSEAYDRLNGIVSRITKRDGLKKPKEELPELPAPVRPSTSRSQLLKESQNAKSNRTRLSIAG